MLKQPWFILITLGAAGTPRVGDEDSRPEANLEYQGFGEGSQADLVYGLTSLAFLSFAALGNERACYTNILTSSLIALEQHEVALTQRTNPSPCVIL